MAKKKKKKIFFTIFFLNMVLKLSQNGPLRNIRGVNLGQRVGFVSYRGKDIQLNETTLIRPI